jgi:DNA-directed RNA polymerase
MNTNEQKMKLKGEAKVWASITNSSGKAKDVSSTQIGQQLLFDEALRILPEFKDWLDNTGKNDKSVFRSVFSDDESTMILILKTLFLMAGNLSGALDRGGKNKTRHKRVNSIQSNFFPEFTFDQTWRVVEVIVDLSRFFEVEKSMSVKRGKFNWNLNYTCNIDEHVFQKISSKALISFYPMPMKEAPLDWGYDEDGNIIGGYKDFQYDMVRSNYRMYKKHKFDDRILDSINYIQSQAWLVNEEVLKEVERNLKIPLKNNFITLDYPDSEGCHFGVDLKKGDHGLSEEEVSSIRSFRKTFQENVDLYQAEARDFESAMGKYRAVKMAIEIANDYKGEDIYFPHSYDSRGRIYPIPVGLSPQGSDAIKAMLKYKDGQVLNRDGAAWAFAYLASLYGDDKLHFEDRVQRGMELMDEDYRDADEPYQFLAHQIELRKVIEDPKATFNGRIHLDACNSGSQFTSALTGDIKGCLATNVVPTIGEDGLCDRQDAYLLVANKSIELTKGILDGNLSDEDRDVYEELLRLLETNGRKICKRPVMVSNYGGTAGGRADMLYDMFRDLKIDRKYITKANAIKFAKIIGDSITGVLNGGKAFEKYIQTMNNIIAKNGKPVVWDTSDGFRVVHVKNKELPKQRVRLKLPKARRETNIIKKSYSKEVSPSKMRSAISPNYIHSLDAELLRRVALRMRDEGITNSDWIHDSFGCLPNEVSRMLEITKEVFLEMMEKDPLLNLDKGLRKQSLLYGTTEKQLSKVEMPRLGCVDFSKILESTWFFS